MIVPRLPRAGVARLLQCTQYLTQTLALAYSVDLHVLQAQTPTRNDSWFLFSTIGIAVIWGIRSLSLASHLCCHRVHSKPSQVASSLRLEGIHFAWALLWVLHLLLATTVEKARFHVVGEAYVLLSLYVAQAALSAAALGHWDAVLQQPLGVPTSNAFRPIASLRHVTGANRWS